MAVGSLLAPRARRDPLARPIEGPIRDALRGLCDVDWVGDANDRQSTMRYVFFVGIGVILWKYKKLPTIALSMTKVEYMVTSHCTKEAIWLRQVVADVGNLEEGPTSIMCTNQRCVAPVKNLAHHSCNKHINIRHQFTNEKLKNQEMYLKYCPTENIVMDVLTKSLTNDKHQVSTKAMGLGSFAYSQSESVAGRALYCL